ncbi:MAG: hypothetical protein HYX60_05615 [Legionella longbeachae]|nr:hypothetical protein [Legionella longbeachae]
MNEKKESALKTPVSLHMRKEFVEKDRKELYLTSEVERIPYLITFKEGKVYNALDICLTEEKLFFIMDEKDRIFAISTESKWNHSFFMAGQPVRAAGIISTNKQGRIDKISNESGHYIPTTKQMLYFLTFIFQHVYKFQGYDEIIYESHDEVPLKNILKDYPLFQIVNIIDEKKSFENQLKEICMGVTDLSNINTQTVQIEGYDNHIVGHDYQLEHIRISRYGLKPANNDTLNTGTCTKKLDNSCLTKEHSESFEKSSNSFSFSCNPINTMFTSSSMSFYEKNLEYNKECDDFSNHK